MKDIWVVISYSGYEDFEIEGYTNTKKEALDWYKKSGFSNTNWNSAVSNAVANKNIRKIKRLT